MKQKADERAFRADRGDARERLDCALARRLADLPGLSRTALQGWIGEGRVRVNGAPAARAALRLALGDEIEVLLPERPSLRPPPAAEPIPLAVLYEDEHLLAVDKPPGLVAHPSSGRRGGTLLNALLWRARGWDAGAAPRLVSRLDRGTSGVLLVAKTGAVHAAAARALKAGGAEKEYLAVAYGPVPAAKGRIDLRILPDPIDRRRRIASRGEGRESLTLWERLAESPRPGTPLALLRCRLATGRTHQIRVHLKACGMPIVGDPLYGEPRWKGIAGPALAALCRDFPRQALHARRLAFPHPVTRRPLEIAAPLPPDLVALLRAAGLAFP